MKSRPLAGLGLLLVAPFLLGALIAPQAAVYIVPLLRRMFPTDDSFATVDFARVINRCLTVAVILLLVPAIRMTGLMPHVRDAIRLTKRRAGTLLTSIGIGLASMSAAYLAGWFLGGYRFSDDPLTARSLATSSAVFLAGAVFIGLFEEIFFRGLVFGALRARCSFGVAAFAASAFFMQLHFLKPALPETFDYTRWYAGFAALAHITDSFDLLRDGAFAATLFLMGLTLCTIYERDGHLHRCIGLHGGWVLAMLLGAHIFDRNPAIIGSLLGPGDIAAHSLIAIPIIAVFLVRATARNPVR